MYPSFNPRIWISKEETGRPSHHVQSSRECVEHTTMLATHLRNAKPWIGPKYVAGSDVSSHRRFVRALEVEIEQKCTRVRATTKPRSSKTISWLSMTVIRWQSVEVKWQVTYILRSWSLTCLKFWGRGRPRAWNSDSRASNSVLRFVCQKISIYT